MFVSITRLIYARKGRVDIPVWVAKAKNLRARVDDLLGRRSRSNPRSEQPVLAYILERNHGQLNGRCPGRHTPCRARSDPRRVVQVDCRQLGQGSYAVPRTLVQVEFATDARYVLAIETGGMFQRLHQHRFWEREQCVLVEMAGVPTRATRRFVRRLSEEHNLPVYCFTDCDPYGFANIYRTLKVGSGNAAHTARLYSVPRARFLGVTPADIHEYGCRTRPIR